MAQIKTLDVEDVKILHNGPAEFKWTEYGDLEIRIRFPMVDDYVLTLSRSEVEEMVDFYSGVPKYPER